MSLQQEQAFSWSDFSTTNEALNEMLFKLLPQTKSGLSEKFKQQSLSQEEAVKACERAMEKLSSDYIEKLTIYKESNEPNTALKALRDSEIVWSNESPMIKYFDKEGKETHFLMEMRSLTLTVLQNRLEELSLLCHKKPSSHLIALMIGTLMTMDSIYSEMKYPEQSPSRISIRNLARNLKPSLLNK